MSPRGLMESAPARSPSTLPDRVPGARPAGDGRERKRGISAAFDRHGAAHHHDRAAHDYATYHWYSAAFDCSTSHEGAAHGHDGASLGGDYGAEAPRDGNGCSIAERVENP